MDKKRRRIKKNLRRNAEWLARKIPKAFKDNRDKREWIDSLVHNHPALKMKEDTNGT